MFGGMDGTFVASEIVEELVQYMLNDEPVPAGTRRHHDDFVCNDFIAYVVDITVLLQRKISGIYF
jgi:hypothetical protein